MNADVKRTIFVLLLLSMLTTVALAHGGAYRGPQGLTPGQRTPTDPPTVPDPSKEKPGTPPQPPGTPPGNPGPSGPIASPERPPEAPKPPRPTAPGWPPD